ncbi:hypothetical protein BDV23DRAFT_154504 [Aspergillus alliaceus]|uniref:Uncharacterized protein n=1 Tax=Petromyces alliaceus TaxID=209559 RepID=A0A5N6FCC9_PETAA|nr:uncharacterized protein BDW43DRAFT_293710 [Aspergillus alliaceus]KAB8227572.1 hypothetical protein BDW43DRAFT_293710 [Aspergillus alliaceus]KAE8390839.1 hypothetical protein BDV23DRAFT_154504 [Aspergillus alliaceus]
MDDLLLQLSLAVYANNRRHRERDPLPDAIQSSTTFVSFSSPWGECRCLLRELTIMIFLGGSFLLRGTWNPE